MAEQPVLALAERPLGDVATVLIVDDEPDMRLLIGLGIRSTDEFEVVGEAATGREAIALARELQPDVILLDLRMPEMDGREALPHLLVVSPRSMVVVLSALQATVEAAAALGMGAFAYVEKTFISDHVPRELVELLQEFRRALRGETVLAGRHAVSLSAAAHDLNR